jgi:hypothetical protein
MEKCYLCQKELTNNEIKHNNDVSFCESAICDNCFTDIFNFVSEKKKE